MPTRRRRARRTANDFEGYVQSYNADVIDGLGIDREEIPACAAGVEIELDYGAAVDRAIAAMDEQFRAGTSMRRIGRQRAASIVTGDVGKMLGKHCIRALYKWDGTIGNGFELATEPLEFRDLLTVADLYADLLTLGKPTVRCGLHVHINRYAFTANKALCSWVWLWSREHTTLILSGRTAKRLYDWADPTRTFPLWEPFNTTETVHQSPTPYTVGEHHCSVCLRRNETAELRVYAAAKTAEDMRQKLDLTLATVRYVNAEEKQPSWERFCAWLHTAQRKRHPHAYAFISKRMTRLQSMSDFTRAMPEPTAVKRRVRKLHRTTEEIIESELSGGHRHISAGIPRLQRILQNTERALQATPILVVEEIEHEPRPRNDDGTYGVSDVIESTPLAWHFFETAVEVAGLRGQLGSAIVTTGRTSSREPEVDAQPSLESCEGSGEYDD